MTTQGEGPAGRETDTLVERLPRGGGLLVAIDGPAGSGKSTVSRRVASALDLSYLDTGATFRAATWWCLDQGVDLADAAAVLAAVEKMPLTMVPVPDAPRVIVDEQDVSAAIRTAELTKNVRHLATNLDVRARLADLQRRILIDETTPGQDSVSDGRGVVTEGRDVTTVIAPDADVRLLLTASEEQRLARRALERLGSVDDSAVAATREEVSGRDASDATVSRFLTASDGVHTLDSSDLTLDQVVEAVLELVRDAQDSRKDAAR